MSYHISGDILKLDIKVPKARAMEMLDIMPEYDFVMVGAQHANLDLDEATQGHEIPCVDGFYVFDKSTLPHIGGNKSMAEEFLTALAKKFGGTFEARFTGEDGSTWACKVVNGAEKKVKIQIVEE